MSVNALEFNDLAILFTTVCAIPNLNEVDSIVDRILSVVASGVLATRCFHTKAAALCWLTDPVMLEAVASSAAGGCTFGSTGAPTSSNAPTGWWAIVARDFRVAVDLELDDMMPAMELLRDLSRGACVVTSFTVFDDVRTWVLGDGVRVVLDIIQPEWPVGVSAVSPRLCVSPPLVRAQRPPCVAEREYSHRYHLCRLELDCATAGVFFLCRAKAVGAVWCHGQPWP